MKPRIPKALVVCLDGVRHDVLTSGRTPALDRLTKDGFLVTSLIYAPPVAETSTGPGVTTMVTGVWPDKHNVTSNVFHGHRLGQYPDFLTRLGSVRPSLATLVAVHWAPLGRAVAGGPVFTPGITHRIVHDVPDGYGHYRPGDERLAAAGPVTLVDVVPTVLDHLGVPADPGWALDGTALSQPGPGRGYPCAGL